MTVAIISYGSGNIHSAQKAFERSAEGLQRRVVVTDSPEEVRAASHIVLPGVGAFGDCLEGIKAVPGMMEALHEVVIEKKRWFLGICVGMQLLADRGMEHGEHQGFGWIKGVVEPIAPLPSEYKIPHMGWNTLDIRGKHPLLNGIETGDHAYFVHSFAMTCEDEKTIVATTEHGKTITAVVASDNIMGTQFHPEKSQKTGLTLIRNFLTL